MSMKFRPTVEPLERRDTPAFTSTLSGGTAQLIGDDAADSFFIVAENGLLRHGTGLAGFASATDWDTTKAGTQTLAASTASIVQFLDLGGGDDTVQLGGLSDTAFNIKAAVVIVTGGGGSDRLTIYNTASTAGLTYAINSVGIQSTGLNVTTLTPMDGGTTLFTGTGPDVVNVASTSGPLTVDGFGGADRVNVGRLGLLDGLVHVSNAAKATAILIDDRENVGGGIVDFADGKTNTVVKRGNVPVVEFDADDVQSLIFRGGSGSDSFLYRATRGVPMSLAGGDGADFFQVSLPAGAVGELGLVGEASDDTFIVNAPLPTGFTLTANGSPNTGVDALIVTGTTATVTHAAGATGTVQAGPGEAVTTFFNMKSVFVGGTPRSVIVNLPAVGANGVLNLADDPQGNDSVLTGPTITPTKFNSPTVSLTVNFGNGGDALAMLAMDPSYAPTGDGLQPGGTFLRGGIGADFFFVVPDEDSVTTVTGGEPTADPGDRLEVNREYPNQTTPTFLSPTVTYTLGRGPGALNYAGIESVELEFADDLITAGTDRGAAEVVRYDTDPEERFRVPAFRNAFTGGVRVASGDFNGDGTLDAVVGTGPGGPTKVRILDGSSQEELFSSDPFEASFTGGVYVAAGDITGDGVPELIITPDEGGGPRVRVFTGGSFAERADFFGIDDKNFRGGARTAVGDFDGDGFGDLIVAAGFGGGPRVAGYKGSATFAAGGPKLFGDFFLFEQTLRNGAFIAAGDVNNDGGADLIGGGGPGGGPRVLILDGNGVLNNMGAQARVLGNFFAGDPNGRGGVRVSARHLDGDGFADVVVGAGTGAGSRVTAYLGKNIAPAGLPAVEVDFEAFPGFFGGVFVG